MKGFDNILASLNKYAVIAKSVILKVSAVEWERSVRMNFEASGRPEKWAPRKHTNKKQKGRKILVISGALKNYRAIVRENEVVMAADPRARAYSKIHNEGGVINVPERKRKFRKNKAGKSVFASKKHKNTEEKTIRAHTITIPQRMHTNIPKSDLPRWINTFKQFLKL